MSLITKLDFTADRVPFTQNLDNRLIEPYITKAQKQDFKPLVSDAFYTAITAETPTAEIQTFLDDYVKEFLVYATMARFLAYHGNIIAQNGMREYVDNTSQPISDTSRAQLIKEAEKDMKIALSVMMKEASDVSYTWDGVVYNFNSDCESSNKNSSFGIRAVGVNTNFDGDGIKYKKIYE